MPDNRRGIADVSAGISWSARLGRRKRSRASTCADPPPLSRRQPVALVDSGQRPDVIKTERFGTTGG